MLSNNTNFNLEYEFMDNDCIKQDSMNFNDYSPTFWKFQNQYDGKINYKTFFNNNNLSTSLIINNYNNENECGNVFKPMINIDNDNKDSEKNLFTSENLKKNYYPFIFKTISFNKEIKNNLLKGNTQLGRKKKDDDSKREHNKYSDDNLRRKCKHLVLKYFIDFINEKLNNLYNYRIYNSLFIKKFLTFNKTQKAESSIEYNKKFLTKTLKDICSDTISSKFTKFSVDHNKNLLKILLNEEDEEKRTYFQKLFNKNFLDCLRHFRGSHFIEEFKGMKCFNDVKEEFSDDKEYLAIVKYHLNNFESIINNKKSRKPKKKI